MRTVEELEADLKGRTPIEILGPITEALEQVRFYSGLAVSLERGYAASRAAVREILERALAEL